MRLKDKIALVTGGSSGIGEAICYAYGKEGAIVIVVNKSSKTGNSVANKIKAEGGRAEAFLCDVSDETAVQKLVNQIIQQYGRIDILVNNVGLAVFKPFEEQTLEDWNFVMNTNLTSAFLMSRAVVPSMKQHRYGKIIFVSSIAATVGFATLVPYSATKGGVLGMAKAMVAELSRYNINVNTISPGSTITPGNRLLENPSIMEKIAQRTARGSPMLAEDLAGAAVYLASDDSKAVHGLDLIVDNAWVSL